MTPEFRELVVNHDEIGLEHAFFDNTCPHFFAVDWREEDSDIVANCAEILELKSLNAEWRNDDLYLVFEGNDVQVPLLFDVADRHITICTLNEVLDSKFEVRFLVFSHGSDTLGFAALSVADWSELEKVNATAVEENFIDPRKLPNIMTELTDNKLPLNARARFERMLARNKAR